MNDSELHPDQKIKRIEFKALKDPIVCIALGLGSGLSPKAPGTAGTLIAVPLVLLLQNSSLMIYGLISLLITVVGVWVCTYSSRKLGVHDHPGIVIDEVAGFLITMFAVPAGWQWMLAGFVLFRFFDAVKPWPISWMDKNVQGGLGIMVDDVAAALVSLAILHSYLYWFV